MKSARAPVLVLSAFEPELAPLRRALKAGVVDARSTIVCAAAGIGVVDAAAGAARAIAARGPRLVLFTGTAGCYGTALAPGGVVIGRRILLASTAVLRGEGYLPAPLAVRADTDTMCRRAIVRAAGGGVPVVDVATPLAITTAPAVARRLAAATGATVENLEAFAVARAAALAGIPFGVVLGVSNRVGPGAHVEWMRHQAQATAAACAVLGTFLVPSSATVTAPTLPRRSRPRRPPA